MAAYDWGLDQPAHPVAAGVAGGEEVAGSPVEELPEVRRLLAEGWSLAPDAPMFAFLPAVWPRDLRTWVPDRAAHLEERSVIDGRTGRLRSQVTVAASPAAQAEVEDDLDALLAESGLTGRPRGRIWLLRPPPGYASVEAFLDEIGRRAVAAGVAAECGPAYVQLTAEALRRWS